MTNRHSIAHRLTYIDYVLLKRGWIQRGDIVRQFGVHQSQASGDIAAYMAAWPDSMRYDKSAKRYVAIDREHRSRCGLTPRVMDAMDALAATQHPLGWRIGANEITQTPTAQPAIPGIP